MDPLSFTASLVTVSGVAIMTSKMVHTLCEKVKSVPKDVGDLLEQLQTFQELLEELQKQLQDFQANATTQSRLSQLWGQSIAHMQRDVESLHAKLSKLEQLLKKKSLGSRVLLSARQMLSEKKVADYRRKFDTHCGVLTCIKATVCDRKLSKLTQDTIQLGNDNKAGFQTISSQVSQATGHLEAEARAGFSNVSSDLKSAKLASDEMHRDLRSRMDAHVQRDGFLHQNVHETRREQRRAVEITEAGLQAVQSALVTAASFNREGHESTHAMLRQQENLMQRLGNQLAFGNRKNCVRSPLSRSNKGGSAITKSTFYWKTLHHSLPIGNLHISMEQTHNYKGSEDSTSPESTESTIAVTFVPPKWLTSLAVNYRMELGYNSIGDQWHWGARLKPLTVNQNPFVIDALSTLDLGAIQKSFREGLIHPKDYALLGEYPVPWFSSLGVNLPPTEYHPRASSVLKYMAENGLPGQGFLLHQIPSRVFYFDEDRLQNDVLIYLQHGGNLSTEGLFRYSVLRALLRRCGQGAANWISECLFHSSESWTIDEFSPFDICFLGAVAQVDSDFRTRLKTYLASYRSPLLAAGSIYADGLLESTLGIASVLSHFHRLDKSESREFLAALCRTGTPSMVKPFIDTGIDLDDGDVYRNLLGNAAEVGNIDMVCMLIERGANGALALRNFIDYGRKLSDGLFKHLLELLVEISRPTSFKWMDDDALLEFISSSKALLIHPEAPEILIRRKVFSDELTKCSCVQYLYCNYMCVAIRKRLASMVELLLQDGAYANTMSTWLMFSVKCGAASCTEALIQHGADVTFLDGAGRSALELARSNVTAPHPRIFEPYAHSNSLRCYVTAGEDAETLAVVERAFHVKGQSMTNLTEYEPECGFEVQSHNHRDEIMPVPQNMLKKALGFLFMYHRPPLQENRMESQYHGIDNVWSLSFYEALLVRFFYVLSYVLLLAMETSAFIRGHKRVHMPSRVALSAVSLLLLAFVWGSSLQTMFPWQPDTGRSVT